MARGIAVFCDAKGLLYRIGNECCNIMRKVVIYIYNLEMEDFL